MALQLRQLLRQLLHRLFVLDRCLLLAVQQRRRALDFDQLLASLRRRQAGGGQGPGSLCRSDGPRLQRLPRLAGRLAVDLGLEGGEALEVLVERPLLLLQRGQLGAGFR